MKRLLILGGGTAGTMVANRLSHELEDDWKITVVDADETHYYQPGFLFIPFGIYSNARRDQAQARLPALWRGDHHLPDRDDRAGSESRAHHQGQPLSVL